MSVPPLEIYILQMSAIEHLKIEQIIRRIAKEARDFYPTLEAIIDRRNINIGADLHNEMKRVGELLKSLDFENGQIELSTYEDIVNIVTSVLKKIPKPGVLVPRNR